MNFNGHFNLDLKCSYTFEKEWKFLRRKGNRQETQRWFHKINNLMIQNEANAKKQISNNWMKEFER